MDQGKVEVQALKAFGEKEKITFSNILAGALVEFVLSQIEKSKYFEYLYLKNSMDLGIEAYRRKKILKLNYFYMENDKIRDAQGRKIGRDWNETLLLDMADKIFGENQNETVKFSWRVEKKEKDYSIRLEADIDKIVVPIELIITAEKHRSIIPKKVKMKTLEQNREVVFYQYPAESILAEDFTFALEKMELIYELDCYGEMDEILSTQTVNGRRVKDELAQYCQNRGILAEEKRLQALLAYHNYPIMRKKWKLYLRKEKKTGPKWEEVMQRLDAFFTPLWMAVREDTLFFGDWMPELQRFLD